MSSKHTSLIISKLNSIWDLRCFEFFILIIAVMVIIPGFITILCFLFFFYSEY